MIITETLTDGRTYTYSDKGFKIKQETGIVYNSAVDQVGVEHTYTETDTPVEHKIINTSDASHIIIEGNARKSKTRQNIRQTMKRWQ